MPDDVSLPEPSGDCFTGCERPNDPRQVRRWQAWKSVPMTARDAHEKRHDLQAAPAASPARGCWAARLTLYASVRERKRIYSLFVVNCFLGYARLFDCPNGSDMFGCSARTLRVVSHSPNSWLRESLWPPLLPP